MSASKCIVVTVDADGMRLDAFLTEAGAFSSRSAAAHACDAGEVLVGGVAAVKSRKLRTGEAVVYTVAEATEHDPLDGIDIPLNVRFEDDWLMVISKQAGLCVHPAPNHVGPTLVNALVYRWGRDHLAHVQGDDRPGIVHRLDMDTSGLMITAKDDDTGNELQDAIRLREVDRHYLTLVHGRIAHDTGMVDAPIRRHPKQRLRMTVGDGTGSRSAVTTFKVLQRFEAGPHDDGYSLLECKLFSGRTHQIRVHMEYIGHCCVGDGIYRSGNDRAQLGLERQFLHSYLLNFTHPRTDDALHFVDLLPASLQGVVDALADRPNEITTAGHEVFAMMDVEGVRPEYDVFAGDAPLI